MNTSPSSSNFTTSISSSDNHLVSRWLLAFHHVQISEIVVALIVFVSIYSLRQRKRHGLPIWPFLGMLPSLILGLRVNWYEWISNVLCRQNGTFRFKGPWYSSLHCVITSDPRNLEHILKTKFPNYPKGEYFQNTLHDLLGNGIFNADGETWQRQRKTASIEFHSAKFRNLTTESLAEIVHSRLIPVLEDLVNNLVPIDLQDVLLRLTFDNVCMIAFGVDPGCLSPGLPEIPFARAFEDATEATMLRFVMPTCVWKAMRYLDLGTEKKLKKSIKEVDEFSKQVIRTRKKELSLSLLHDGDDNKSQKSDLLTVFMGLKDDEQDGKPYSDKFLRDICVNFILAGKDTSSVALSWFFWLLDRNPAVEERILEELCRIVGERKNVEKKNGKESESGSLIFRPEEVKKMEYLHAALSEVLRLYPSLPVDHKEVVEDDEFPDGTVLKKGMKVIYAIYAMGRMESLWGKDCREYKPERWLRDGRFMSESTYKYAVFNSGPRLCLGKDFAYFQMKFTAASILYRYQMKVVEDHPVVPKLALTMYLKHGLKVNLYRRDESELRKYF